MKPTIKSKASEVGIAQEVESTINWDDCGHKIKLPLSIFKCNDMRNSFFLREEVELYTRSCFLEKEKRITGRRSRQ